MKPKIIVCPDSFKGSLTAAEAAGSISAALSSLFSDAEIVSIPLSDGGEGSLSLLTGSQYAVERHFVSYDALFRPVECKVFFTSDNRKCIIESADTIGMERIERKLLNPLVASSYGLGVAIAESIRFGAREVTVTLGGSAVCDGGIGMLHALGYSFLDVEGNDLSGSAKDMLQISSIHKTDRIRDLEDISFNIVCDVENPLYGANGASFVFAPQKGATPEQVLQLDRGLRNLDAVAVKNLFAVPGASSLEGAGAAGGLGYAFRTFLNATYFKGIDYVFDRLDFDKRIKDADLLITGEGCIDSQSLMGKVLNGVLSKASVYDIPVIAFAGIVRNDCSLNHPMLKNCIPVADSDVGMIENMKKEKAKENLSLAVKQNYDMINALLPNNFEITPLR